LAALTILGLAIVKPFVVRAQTLMAATASERFLNRLRMTAFDKLQGLPLGFFEQERTGVLISRLTSDVQALDEFLREALVEVIGSGLQIALTVVALVYFSPLVAVLLLASSMYRNGSISQGTIAAYVLYLVQLFDPIARFSEWLGEFRQGLAALGKVVGLIRTENAVAERTEAVELPADSVLELSEVTFGYDGGAPVVKDVSLALDAGEHVALVGVTGAGK